MIGAAPETTLVAAAMPIPIPIRTRPLGRASCALWGCLDARAAAKDPSPVAAAMGSSISPPATAECPSTLWMNPGTMNNTPNRTKLTTMRPMADVRKW